jgi:hypothetical protein
MAERKPKSESKFAGIFQQATPTAEAREVTTSAEIPHDQSAAPAAKPLGRPPGKRSDPAWKQFSVLLKRDTQRQAASILRVKDDGLDLSDLLQNLLEGWIKRQKQ